MAAAFLIAFVLASVILLIFGVGERGTGLALRATARWSFLLFWLAYAGNAMATLFGPFFAGLARRGRDLGLAFASAQLIHIGLVLWVIYIATEPLGNMLFFWVGILCTYLLALFSIRPVRAALGPRLWRTFRTLAVEYIAIVFAADFIIGSLQANKFDKYYFITYLPFSLMLAGAVGLRVVASARQQRRIMVFMASMSCR